MFLFFRVRLPSHVPLHDEGVESGRQAGGAFLVYELFHHDVNVIYISIEEQIPVLSIQNFVCSISNVKNMILNCSKYLINRHTDC